MFCKFLKSEDCEVGGGGGILYAKSFYVGVIVVYI